jgi:hypothetical protein
MAHFNSHRAHFNFHKANPEWLQWLAQLKLHPWKIATVPAELQLDLDFIKAALDVNPNVFQFCFRFRSHEDIAHYAVIRNPKLMIDVSGDLQRNEEFVEKALRKNARVYDYCPQFSRNKKLTILAASVDGDLLEYSPLKDDKEVMLAIVQLNGLAIKYASPRLWHDPELARAAVMNNSHALLHLPPDLRDELAYTALARCGRLLEHLSLKIKGDKASVQAAVQQDGLAICYANEGLKDDVDVVLAAVTQNGFALGHVSNGMRDDERVVHAAVAQNGEAIKSVSDRLRVNRAVMLAALDQSPAALYYMGLGERDDEALVLLSVSRKGAMLRHASKRLQGDSTIVWAAVINEPLAMQYASIEMRGDLEFAHAVVAMDPTTYRRLSVDLRGHKELAKLAVSTCGKILDEVSRDLQDDPEVVVLAVADCAEAFEYASARLKNGGLLEFTHGLIVEHRTFMQFMLGSRHRFAFKRSRSETCVLAKLNTQGPYFAVNFKKLIAAYVGAPLGKAYTTVRKASQNAHAECAR